MSSKRHVRSRPGPAASAVGLSRLQKIPRSTRTPGTVSRRGRGAGGGRQFNRILAVGLGGLMVLLVALLVWVLLPDRPGTTRGASLPAVGFEGRPSAPIFTPALGERLVARALDAADPASLLPLMREPGALAPGEAFEFLRRQRLDPGSTIHWLGPSPAESAEIQMFLIPSGEERRSRNHLVLLTPGSDGSWRIDFDAFARFSDPPLESWRPEAAGTALVRLVAGPDFYFNGAFSDESVWDCYSLVDEDLEQPLIGYCRRDGPQSRALRAIAQRDASPGRKARVTLELSRPPDALERQVLIERVLSDDWVLGDKPFDEGFRADPPP